MEKQEEGIRSRWGGVGERHGGEKQHGVLGEQEASVGHKESMDG